MVINSNRKPILFWSVFISFCLIFLTVTLVLNSKEQRYEIKNYFYPVSHGVIKCDRSDDWNTVSFSRLDVSSNEYLDEKFSYSTPFAHKLLVCSASSSDKANVEIRVLDSDGNVVINNTILKCDSTISLGTLENDKEYILQCRFGDGKYYFNIC